MMWVNNLTALNTWTAQIDHGELKIKQKKVHGIQSDIKRGGGMELGVKRKSGNKYFQNSLYEILNETNKILYTILKWLALKTYMQVKSYRFNQLCWGMYMYKNVHICIQLK